MIIGAHVNNEKGGKGVKYSSWLSSTNSDFSKYFSRVFTQDNTSFNVENIRSFIRTSVTVYFKTNKKVPTTILYFREGITKN